MITLLEAHRHFRDDRFADAALRGSRAIAAAVDDRDISSLYFGLTGMGFALRAVGRLLGDTAADRAADRALAGPSGFQVLHSDPQHKPERTGRYSFGWCHGPAGDAQVFRLLGAVTGDPAWPALAERCWRTVTGSGLPRRIRLGHGQRRDHPGIATVRPRRRRKRPVLRRHLAGPSRGAARPGPWPPLLTFESGHDGRFLCP